MTLREELEEFLDWFRYHWTPFRWRYWEVFAVVGAALLIWGLTGFIEDPAWRLVIFWEEQPVPIPITRMASALGAALLVFGLVSRKPVQ